VSDAVAVLIDAITMRFTGVYLVFVFVWDSLQFNSVVRSAKNLFKMLVCKNVHFKIVIVLNVQ